MCKCSEKMIAARFKMSFTTLYGMQVLDIIEDAHVEIWIKG